MSISAKLIEFSPVNSKSGCWEWTRTKNRGYGVTVLNGARIYVHRLMWQLVHGAIPGGMLVLHRCDNPACINPDHLFLGTHQDNSSDMVAKGRSIIRRGEACPTAKLTWAVVKKIKADPRTHHVIAAEVGVARSTISMIKSGRHWRE